MSAGVAAVGGVPSSPPSGGDMGPTAAEILGVDVPAPLFRVPDPSPDPDSPWFVEGVWFDEAAVDRVVSCLRSLRHQKGRWRGDPIELERWQVDHFVAPVFGWRRPDGRRVRRTAYLEVPRKNGKTTLCAGLALVLLAADGEEAPEVYAAATTYAQALKLWLPAVEMATGSPVLARKVRRVRGGQTKEHLQVPGNGGEFWPLGRNADAVHGANPHAAVVDELHLHPDTALVDALDTGMVARAQPLLIVITTADEGMTGTPYDEFRRMVEGLAAGTVPYDPAVYGAVFAAAETMDPFSDEAIAAANPNLGVTVRLEDIQSQAQKARQMPSYEAAYRRLHLGQRRRSSVRWLPADYWLACPRLVDEREVEGVRGWAALDMASVDDFVAWVMVFPMPVEVPPWRPGEDAVVDPDGVAVVSRFWVPEGAVHRRRRFADTLWSWEADGWLTVTEGDAVDYEAVRAGVKADLERFDVRTVGFDPWQSRQFMQELESTSGLDVVEVRPTFRVLAPGAHWLEGAVLRRAVKWDSPVLTWMVGNAVPRRDPDNRVKPDKRSSSEKIDGVSALVMALAAWQDGEDPPDLVAQVR